MIKKMWADCEGLLDVKEAEDDPNRLSAIKLRLNTKCDYELGCVKPVWITDRDPFENVRKVLKTEPNAMKLLQAYEKDKENFDSSIALTTGSSAKLTTGEGAG